MKPPTKRISQIALQKMFNEGGYYEQTKTGELTLSIREHTHSTPVKSGQPYCSYSQIIEYRDASSGERIAIVHQYLKPDGSLGASGWPDPQAILKDGVLLIPIKA
jgi:hypothetical protein